VINPQYRFNDFDPPIPFLTGDASALHSIITEVDRVLNSPREEIEKRQAQYLYRLVLHFWGQSETFRKRFQGNPNEVGLCNLSEMLGRISPQAKPYFQNLSEKGEAIKVPKHHLPTHWSITSGSTGTPLKVRGTAITRAIGMAQVSWAHLVSGVDFSWRLASAKPLNKRTSVSESWDPSTSLLFEVGPMLSVPTSIDAVEQLSCLREFRPDFLITFPNVLKEYLSMWDQGLAEPLQLKMIRTMGETLPEEIRSMAESVTGAVVLDTYSSSEVERIATQIAPDGPYIVNSYSLIVEVLNSQGERCQPGEMGRVVVTDLMNYATPLIRYDIGDYAIPLDLSHNTLHRVVGRSRNMVTLPSGQRVWPLVGYRDFCKIAPVRQFHIRQVSPSELKVQFYVSRMLSDAEINEVKMVICQSLGCPFDIDIECRTSPLEKPANGKLEDFVSLL
jgi:phenylacetate-CoA ligase